MTLFNGDCLEVLKTLPDNSVDSLVTDPPAGISFMGKSWDHDLGGRLQWIGWMTIVMAECKRVMKPGAHGLVWALPRTSHWTATALEEAGFEVRDVITHHFGSGFPKSLDVSKAIDKATGAGRVEVGANPNARPNCQGNKSGSLSGKWSFQPITAPATDAAKQWQGFGTALKPASEHWILVRKPCCEKTVAANVLKWGTGALNIDASRIGGAYKWRASDSKDFGESSFKTGSFGDGPHAQGRFPANLVFSCPCDSDQHELGCAVGELDRQSLAGGMHGAGRARPAKNEHANNAYGYGKAAGASGRLGDAGGASRFFYCAKISNSERNAGLEGMEAKRAPLGDDRPSGGSMSRLDGRPERMNQNTHPTVKPQKLMRYLITMVTPPGGVVLDPFLGSGSTGCAAVALGFQFIGIEREREYFDIAKRRIKNGSSPTR